MAGGENNQVRAGLVEQAVFTSARTARRDGYHIVAKSPDADTEDLRELAKWGPTHDSLNPSCPASGSLNCHPLQSGKVCVSRTVKAGHEYSQRGGARIYTQSLILPLSMYRRFACSPFRVAEAVSAAGHWKVLSEFPAHLAPIRLIGKSSTVDAEALEGLIDRMGVDAIATLLQAALSTNCLAIQGGPAPHQLLSGLISLLPPATRMQFSLTTGLCYSPTRKFRIVIFDREADPSTLARFRRSRDAAVFDAGKSQADCFPDRCPWVSAVEQILRSSSWSLLQAFYRSEEDRANPPSFDQYADSLREATRSISASSDSKSERATIPISPRSVDAARPQPKIDCRFDAPSIRASTTPALRCPPSSVHESSTASLLSLDEGPLLGLLDRLDESVLNAIDGDPEAIHRVRELWTSVSTELDPELVDESRHQYLLLALRNWLETGREPGTTQASAAISVLDVLAILFSHDG